MANIITESLREFQSNRISPHLARRHPSTPPRPPTANYRVSIAQFLYPVGYAAQAVRDAKKELRACEAVYGESPSEDALLKILAARMRLDAARLAVRKLSRSQTRKLQG